jgi:hypothetical protein
MLYKINEASFDLPDKEIQDATLNVLRFPALNTSLIVTRSLLAKGDTLESNFDDQLQALEGKLDQLRFQGKQKILVGPKSKIPAIEVRTQFKRGEDHIYQFQLAFVIPNTEKIMALTYAKSAPLGEAELDHWMNLKSSLNFLP